MRFPTIPIEIGTRVVCVENILGATNIDITADSFVLFVKV